MGYITSVLQISATLIAITGLYLVWNQLKLLHRQITFQSLTHYQEIITRPELQKALRFVYSCAPNRLANPSYTEELEKIELILNNYDLLAWHIKKRVVPLDDVLEIEWPVILRFWKQLEKFVDKEKKGRGNVPCKENLRWLVEKAEEYKDKYYPDLPIIILNKSGLIERRPKKIRNYYPSLPTNKSGLIKRMKKGASV